MRSFAVAAAVYHHISPETPRSPPPVPDKIIVSGGNRKPIYNAARCRGSSGTRRISRTSLDQILQYYNINKVHEYNIQ